MSGGFAKTAKLCRDCVRDQAEQKRGGRGRNTVLCPMCKTKQSHVRSHYRNYHPDLPFPQSANDILTTGTESRIATLTSLQNQADINWDWEETSRRIYFVQAGGADRPIKIGISRTLRDRMSGLQVANPEQLNVLLTYEGTPEEELEIQNLFEAHWISGEWFKSHPDLLDFILDKAMAKKPTPSWPQKEVKPRFTFEEHQTLAKALGVKTAKAWWGLYDAGNLPVGIRKDMINFKEWQGWPAFLGTHQKRGRPRGRGGSPVRERV